MWVSWWTKRDLGRFFAGFLPFSPTINFIPPFLHIHVIHFVPFHQPLWWCVRRGRPAPLLLTDLYVGASPHHIPRPELVSDTSWGYLIALLTPSLHIEMVMYCTSYTNNRTCQIACKYTGIKICYKNDKFSFEGDKSKVVRGTVLHGRLAKWRKWRASDVGEAKGFQNELWRRGSHRLFSNPSVASPTSQLISQLAKLILQTFRHFPYVTAQSPTLPSLHLRHSSFSKLPVTSPTSKLSLQPFRHFPYVSAHSSTLLLLHLHHSSFSNPSFASPTSQALHLIHLASRPRQVPTALKFS